jgi:hypothetical protein
MKPVLGRVDVYRKARVAPVTIIGREGKVSRIVAFKIAGPGFSVAPDAVNQSDWGANYCETVLWRNAGSVGVRSRGRK